MFPRTSDLIAFAQKVIAYTHALDQAGFVASGLNYDATLRNLELIGEAATHVPEDVRSDRFCPKGHCLYPRARPGRLCRQRTELRRHLAQSRVDRGSGHSCSRGRPIGSLLPKRSLPIPTRSTRQALSPAD